MKLEHLQLETRKGCSCCTASPSATEYSIRSADVSVRATDGAAVLAFCEASSIEINEIVACAVKFAGAVRVAVAKSRVDVAVRCQDSQSCEPKEHCDYIGGDGELRMIGCEVDGGC